MSDDLVKRLRMDIEPNEGDMEAAADLIEAQAARIAELEAALATARQDALAEAARTVEIMWLMFREKDDGASDWIFRAYDDIPTGDDFATAIRDDPAVLRARAALEEGKDEPTPSA